jgi:hypothetical protein
MHTYTSSGPSSLPYIVSDGPSPDME